MPSALKKLKADLHEKRTSKPRPGSAQHPPKSVKSNKFSAQALRKHETPAQKAYRIRKETLLPEIRRRNKAGGITDRRIGENDPTLAPEDRMLQRYAAEGQRKRKADVFDLEDEEDGGEEMLTHMGRPLNDGNRLERLAKMKEGLEGGGGKSDDEDDSRGELFARSKRRLEDAIDEVTRVQEAAEENGEPAKKKSKTEVMKEVIAKSKFHKHERQAEKENYDDEREELDKQMPNLLALLGGSARKTAASHGNVANGMNGANGISPVDGDTKVDPDKKYDQRVRQLTQDQRAKPTTRTKTDEEKAEEHAAHLRKLEENRLRRMRGELEVHSDASNESDEEDDASEQEQDVGQDADEAAEFGLKPVQSAKTDLDVEDEDEFVIDEDLIASGSDLDISDEDSKDGSDGSKEPGQADGDPAAANEDDAEFLRDVLPTTKGSSEKPDQPSQSLGSLAYTYPCPQTHGELLEVVSELAYTDIPTVVQRIRALYHPSLAKGNSDKLAAFACVLIDHISYLTTVTPAPPLEVIEQLTRHIHSISRAQPLPIGHRFREHLHRMHEAASSATPGDGTWLEPGDLTILTAIGTIYPTGDHFHQVVTPAITLIARWLGTTTTPSFQDVLTSRSGAYLVSLILRYQRLSRRYVPEAVRFTSEVLSNILSAISISTTTFKPPVIKVATQHIRNLTSLADLYASKTAFIDIFIHASNTLHTIARTSSPLQTIAKPASKHLTASLTTARLARRPLELHHHKPRAIRTSVPLFDEHFNPTKHYDPDPDRSETAKLRKEHKKEKKSAMRELRRDAEFVAREKLRERKEKDRVYEEKFRRIIGGIEREEGEGKNQYEKEKEVRRRVKRGR